MLFPYFQRVFGKDDEEVEVVEDAEDEDAEDEDAEEGPFSIEDLFEEAFQSGNTADTLPMHFRCACHTLALVAQDAEKTHELGPHKKVIRGAWAKGHHLWNKQSRSQLVAGD